MKNWEEWSRSDDACDMLAWVSRVTRQPSGRKLRLFACAIHRLIGKGYANDLDVRRSLSSLARAEALADGRDPGLRSLMTPQHWVDDEEARSSAEQAAYAARCMGLREAANVLRDIFTRPVLRPDLVTWLAANDGTVRDLALVIYDEQVFDRIPILGDALQDAGCTDEEILAHCRGDCHYRGCWVVDLLLGRG